MEFAMGKNRQVALVGLIFDLIAKVGPHQTLLNECAKYLRDNVIPLCLKGMRTTMRLLQRKCYENDK